MQGAYALVRGGSSASNLLEPSAFDICSGLNPCSGTFGIAKAFDFLL